MHSTFTYLSRVTRQFLLLALLLSCAAIGAGVDHSPFAGKPANLSSQLDLVSSNHVALIGQKDSLRPLKRFEFDDSSDAPWLLSTSVVIALPSYGVPLPFGPAIVSVAEVSVLSHTPRAPPALS